MYLLLIGFAHATGFVDHFTSTVAAATGVYVDNFIVDVKELKLRSCSTNQITTVTINSTYDFAHGESPTVPAGTWCGITMTLNNPIDLDGHVTNGATFGASLSLDRVPFPTTGNGITVGSYSGTGVFRAANTDWITATMLNLAAGTHKEYIQGDSIYTTMMDAVAETSGALP